MLVLDAGDALTKGHPNGPGELDRRQAGTILEAMGRMGCTAMAVGERDVAIGVDELKRHAAKAGVTLLAANLVDKAGKKPFAERKLINVGGVQVGIFAVSAAPEFAAQGLTALPAAEQAQAQANALRKAGAKLVIGLLHLDYDTSLKVADGLKGVDYAIQSHGGRISSTQLVGSTVLAAGGERGRQLGRAVFELNGSGPLFDLSQAAVAREQLGYLEQNVAQLRQQLKENPAGKAQTEEMIKHLVRRREELLKTMSAKAPAGRRSVLTEMVTLGPQVSDDPQIRAMISSAGAPAPGAH